MQDARSLVPPYEKNSTRTTTIGWNRHKRMLPLQLCDVSLHYPASSPPPTHRLCAWRCSSPISLDDGDDVHIPQTRASAPRKSFQRLAARCDQSGHRPLAASKLTPTHPSTRMVMMVFEALAQQLTRTTQDLGVLQYECSRR